MGRRRASRGAAVEMCGARALVARDEDDAQDAGGRDQRNGRHVDERRCGKAELAKRAGGVIVAFCVVGGRLARRGVGQGPVNRRLCGMQLAGFESRSGAASRSGERGRIEREGMRQHGGADDQRGEYSKGHFGARPNGAKLTVTR